MFNDEYDNEELEVLEETDLQVIIPLKDWHIVFNEHDITLVEGDEIEVPKIFLENLKTEKVID